MLFGRLDLENKIIYNAVKVHICWVCWFQILGPALLSNFISCPTLSGPVGYFLLAPWDRARTETPFFTAPLDLSRRPRSFTSVNAFQVAPTAPICQTSLYMDWFQNSKKRCASQISANFHLGYIWPATPVEVEHFSHVTLVRALTEHLTARE